MKTNQIEIHNEDENITGTYKVWFTSPTDGKKYFTRMTYEEICSQLLTFGQAEKFFMGKFRFTLLSDKFKLLDKKISWINQTFHEVVKAL